MHFLPYMIHTLSSDLTFESLTTDDRFSDRLEGISNLQFVMSIYVCRKSMKLAHDETSKLQVYKTHGVSRDTITTGQGKEKMMVMTFTHGVPSFDAWLEQFKSQEAMEIHQRLGIKKSVVSRTRNSDGVECCHVIHSFPSSRVDMLKKFFDFDGPPFVGGPDLIKNGMVIQPIDVQFAVVEEELSFAARYQKSFLHDCCPFFFGGAAH